MLQGALEDRGRDVTGGLHGGVDTDRLEAAQHLDGEGVLHHRLTAGQGDAAPRLLEEDAVRLAGLEQLLDRAGAAGG